ncbi:hypothetical protein Tco_1120725 [Tanacetum coccineum]
MIVTSLKTEFLTGSLSSSEADSDEGVIGLAISLPLCLVDALDLVEDACFHEHQRACDIRLYPSRAVA